MSFDLDNSETGGLDLSSDFSGSLDKTASMELNLGVNTADSGLDNDFNLDLGSSADTGLDFSAELESDSADQSGLNIGMGQSTNDLDIDFSEPADAGSPVGGMNLSLDDDEDPFAAPEGIDISLDQPTGPSNAGNFDLTSEEEPAAPTDFDLSDSEENSDILQIDAQTATVETEGFDFGDLDSGVGSEAVNIEESTEDDFSGLIVDNSAGLDTSDLEVEQSIEDISTDFDISSDSVEEFNVDVTDDSDDLGVTTVETTEISLDDEGDDFLDGLVVSNEIVPTPVKPAPPAKVAVPEKPAAPAAKASPVKKQVAAPVVEEDSDDDLSNLILGIEGTAKPIAKAPAAEPDFFEETEEDLAISETPDSEPDFDYNDPDETNKRYDRRFPALYTL